MQEVFKKIIERLEENSYAEVIDDMDPYGDIEHKVVSLDKAIEIVKQEAEKIGTDTNVGSNGWIPCDVEMPEEHDSIFAKYKDTDKWNNQMFEKTSDTVNVTVVDRYGNRITTHARTIDGKWSCDLLRVDKSYRIIAWQPLPDPYQPKGEHDENTN